jgi:hypothetical protein
VSDWAPYGSADIRTIVGGDEGVAPECIGLLLDPEVDEVIGCLPESPAAKVGIDAAAKAAGLPINEQRIMELAQLAADATVIGSLSWHETRGRLG